MESLKRKRSFFWIIILFIGAVRIYFIMGMPLQITGNSPHDDMALVNLAYSILNGEWLGEYNRYTLMKVPMYSLFLSACSFLNIPYLMGLGILYTSACITLIISVKEVIKNKVALIVVYCFILFSPVMFSFTAQKVYRMAIIPASVIFVISYISGFYFRRNKEIKTLVPWSIGGGLSLVFFWFIREDSIWLLPFVIGAISITIISIYVTYKNQKKEVLKRSFLSIIPLLILLCANFVLCATNYYHYGIFVTTDLKDTSFSKVISNIYMIEPDEEKPYIWVNKSTVEKLYEVSPAFMSMKDAIEAVYQGGWQRHGKYPNDGEIDGVYFMWALRDVVADAGYYRNGRDTNNFYEKLNSDIEAAFKTGSLAKRKSFMFSSLARSWNPDNVVVLYDTAKETIGSLLDYEKLNAVLAESNAESPEIVRNLRLTELITKDNLIYPNKHYRFMAGWMFATKDTDKLEAVVRGDSGLEYHIEFLDSPDVYNHFLKSNSKYKNAHNSRFALRTNEFQNKLTLDIYINGELRNSMDIDEIGAVETDEYKIYLDYNSIINEYDYAKDIFKKNVDLSNSIISIYTRIGIPIALLSIVFYILATICVILELIKKDYTLLPVWLMLTGILVSFLILAGGVSYNYMEAWNKSGRWVYMSGAYPLMHMFEGISISVIIIYINDRIKAKIVR